MGSVSKKHGGRGAVASKMIKIALDCGHGAGCLNVVKDGNGSSLGADAKAHGLLQLACR